MDKAIALGCVLAFVTAAAIASEKVDPGPIGSDGGVPLLDCSGAVSVTCGGTSTNSTPDGSAGAGNVSTYGCTGLDYSDAWEFVYEICVDQPGDLTVEMTYTHVSTANDLDLFLLGSCDESDCLDLSTGVSGTETVEFIGAAAGTYYVVVDGWRGEQDGSAHTVRVVCDAPCSTPVEPSTWGQIKAQHSE